MYIVAPSVLKTCSWYRDMTTPHLVGTGADNGKLVWHSARLNKWIIVNTGAWDATITFNGTSLGPYNVPVNGLPAWTGGSYCLYHLGVIDAWVVRAKGNIGQVTTVIPDTETWWLGGSNPIGSFTKKGAAPSNQTSTITSWGRWESLTMFGKYEPVSPASGELTVGLIYYEDAGGAQYIRSLEKVGGKFTYGAVHYDADNSVWVIGSVGSSGGWWQSASIGDESDYTFSFTQPEGGTLETPDKSLTFEGYTGGDNEMPMTYLGEAAIWRM